MSFSKITTVCTYVLKMMRLREVVHANIQPEALAKKMNEEKYVVVLGSRENSKCRANATFCLLLIGAQELATKSPDFANMLTKVDRIIKGSNPTISHLELCIISPDGLSKNAEKKLPTAWSGFSTIITEHHSYYIFGQDATDHVYVDPHELLSHDEVLEIEKICFLSKYGFPRCKKNDAQAVMYGARPGDVFRVTSTSETACEYIVYLIVMDELKNI